MQELIQTANGAVLPLIDAAEEEAARNQEVVDYARNEAILRYGQKERDYEWRGDRQGFFRYLLDRNNDLVYAIRFNQRHNNGVFVVQDRDELALVQAYLRRFGVDFNNLPPQRAYFRTLYGKRKKG